MLVWPVSRPPVLEHEKELVVYTPVKKKATIPTAATWMLFGLMDSEGLYSIAINMGGLVSVLFHLYAPPPLAPHTHTHSQQPPLSSNSVAPLPPAPRLLSQHPYLPTPPPPPLAACLFYFCGELCYDKGFTPRMRAVSACVMPL